MSRPTLSRTDADIAALAAPPLPAGPDRRMSHGAWLAARELLLAVMAEQQRRLRTDKVRYDRQHAQSLLDRCAAQLGVLERLPASPADGDPA